MKEKRTRYTIGKMSREMIDCKAIWDAQRKREASLPRCPICGGHLNNNALKRICPACGSRIAAE